MKGVEEKKGEEQNTREDRRGGRCTCNKMRKKRKKIGKRKGRKEMEEIT